MTTSQLHSQTRRAGLAAALLAALAAASTASAADVVKLATGALNATTGWDTTALPGAGNTAVFNSTTATGAITFNGSGTASALTWGALKVADIGGKVTINPVATVTIGALGGTIIDMSAATNDVEFSAGTVRLGASAAASINIAPGRTLTVSGLTNNSGTREYTFTGGGNFVANGSAGSGGVFQLKVDGANVTFNGASNTFARAILTSGSLTVNSTALTTGAFTVNGGAFTVNSSGVGALALSANQNFTMTTGTWTVSFNGSTADSISGSGTGAASITGGTLALAGLTDYSTTYQLLSGFSTQSVSGLSITGYDSANWIANVSNTGALSFASAVPEPSAFAALAGVAGLGCAALRRRRRA